MHKTYASPFKAHGNRPFCVRMQHESVRRFVRPAKLTGHSHPAARFCTRPTVPSHTDSYAINQVLIRYAAELYEPRYSPARDPQFLLDLPRAAWRTRSAPDMRSRMRSPSRAPSFCFGKPVWLPCIPTKCPNTAKAPCVSCTLPARREAWNRPSRARFRPTAAAGSARRHPGAAQARLSGPVTRPHAGTPSCSPARPTALSVLQWMWGGYQMKAPSMF